MSTNEFVQASPITQRKSTRDAQWMLDTPEYLLILVVAFIVWTPGFIELMNNTSQNPTILGFYSPARFAGLVAYALVFPILLVLMFRPSHSGWLTQSISFIQNRSWLAIGLLALMGFGIWLLVTADLEIGPTLGNRLSFFPFLRLSLAGVLVLASGLILFGGWRQASPLPRWRKAIAWGLGILVVIELIIQITAFGGWLPGPHQLNRLFPAYGRVYQNAEGAASGRANNYGLNYPDFEFRPDAQRVLLLGDSYIQALQVEGEEHLGVTLESLQNDATPETDVEVLAMGLPGFGPGLYLSEYHIGDTVQEFQPDEIILFFHLANDFQHTTVPTPDDIVYQMTPDGEVVIHPDSKEQLHGLTHFITPAYREIIDPLAALNSYYLTPKLLANMRTPQEPQPQANSLDIPVTRGYIINQIIEESGFAKIKKIGVAKAPGAANFLFEKEGTPQAEESFALATGLLKQTQDYLESEGVALRIVTIPAFPAAFYTDNKDPEWMSEIGPYDLFGPEQALQAFAVEAGIPILPLGSYMQKDGLGVSEVQALFFDNGAGHFTSEGHDYVAEAIYRCFFVTDGSEAPPKCALE